MTRRAAIGFDRRIDLAWLDAAAGKVSSGATTKEVRDYLWETLDGVVVGEKTNSARGKTVTVLSHIWCQVPECAVPLRDRAVKLLADVNSTQRLAVHWAMVMGTYPFATDVAGAVGRLLTLQGNVTLSQLVRRLAETWGQRSTMERAAQRVLRSMVQWGVLRDTADRGTYEGVDRRQRVADRMAELLIEGILIDSGQQVLPVEQLLSHPALFPFDLAIGAHHLRRSDQFQVFRQGLDTDVVGLADRPPRHKTTG